MAGETIGLDIVRLVLFPAAGFLAGFAAQWFLQARRSRDELVRALASERAAVRSTCRGRRPSGSSTCSIRCGRSSLARPNSRRE